MYFMSDWLWPICLYCMVVGDALSSHKTLDSKKVPFHSNLKEAQRWLVRPGLVWRPLVEDSIELFITQKGLREGGFLE